MTQIALKTLLCTHKPPKRHPCAVTGYCAALGMFAAGTSATCLSYDSLQPLAAYLSLAGLGALILWVFQVNSPMERLAYTVLFAVGTVAGAINAVYMRQLDSLDGETDAVANYHGATAHFLHESLPDLRVLTEGALSTYVWRELYTVWSLLGGDKEMYLGIAVNCTLVGLSAAIGIRIVRMVFGEDWYRCRRMLLLMATCGPLMLSAGTHLREAFVALLVAIIVLVWLNWLTCPKSTARAAYCVVATGSTTAAFSLLRTELLLFPLLAAAVGLSAYLLLRARSERLFTPPVIIMAAAFLGAAALYSDQLLEMLAYATERHASYAELGAKTAAQTSMGMTLVVNQPMLVRVPVGAIYMLMAPIPVWTPATAGTAYHLFLGLRGLQFYFVLPLLIMAVGELARHRPARTAPLAFLLALNLCLVAGLAGSSLEGRHLAGIAIPIFALATLPDLRSPRVWSQYKLLTFGTLAFMAAIHFAWLVLKSQW